MKNVTFIDTIITNMSSHKNRNGAIAKLVDEQDAPLAANRIASAWDALGEARQTARLESVRTGIPAEQAEIKPEHFPSFVQQVMNNSCWAARRVANSGKRKDLANGLDFSQSVAEQAGNIESAALKDIEVTLMDDFAVLNELHSWLCSEMNYLTDLDPLFLFAEKQCIDEDQQIWEHTHMLMDINDVFAVLEEKSLELAEQSKVKKTTFAKTHVFGAKAKPKAKAKTKATGKKAA